MFLRPFRESNKDLPSAWCPLCCQTGEQRSGSKPFPLQGFPSFPSSPYNPPTHTTKCLPPQIFTALIFTFPLLLYSVAPLLPLLLCFLLIAAVRCRTQIKACSDLQEGRTVSQHHWRDLQTSRPPDLQTSRPPDPHPHRDVSPGWLVDWLAHRGAVCPMG